MNKVILIGNIGKDPEIRVLNGGGKIATFSLATSERWKDKDSGERKERTEWHNIVIYNEPLVKVVEAYCKKGTKLAIEGKLQTRKWQDQSGADKYTTEIVLQPYQGSLELLSEAKRDPEEGKVIPLRGAADYADRRSGKPTPIVDDEIPF